LGITDPFTLKPNQVDNSHDAGLVGPPIVSINNVTVKEGNAGTVAATFAVSLSAPPNRRVTGDYQIQNDSAQASSYTGSTFHSRDFLTVAQTAFDDHDRPFIPLTGRLVFEAGVRVQQLTLPVNSDIVDEYNEQFRVHLTNPVNASFPTNAGFIEGIGTIADDDAPPTVTISDGVPLDQFGNPIIPVDPADSSVFVEADFRGLSDLVAKLTAHSNALSQHLWNQFDLATRQVLMNANSTVEQLQAALVAGLNAIIVGNSLYPLAQTAGISLSSET